MEQPARGCASEKRIVRTLIEEVVVPCREPVGAILTAFDVVPDEADEEASRLTACERAKDDIERSVAVRCQSLPAAKYTVCLALVLSETVEIDAIKRSPSWTRPLAVAALVRSEGVVRYADTNDVSLRNRALPVSANPLASLANQLAIGECRLRQRSNAGGPFVIVTAGNRPKPSCLDVCGRVT